MKNSITLSLRNSWSSSVSRSFEDISTVPMDDVDALAPSPAGVWGKITLMFPMR